MAVRPSRRAGVAYLADLCSLGNLEAATAGDPAHVGISGLYALLVGDVDDEEVDPLGQNEQITPCSRRVCEHCDEAFTAHRAHARYCSGACRVAAHRARQAEVTVLDMTPAPIRGPAAGLLRAAALIRFARAHDAEMLGHLLGESVLDANDAVQVIYALIGLVGKVCDEHDVDLNGWLDHALPLLGIKLASAGTVRVGTKFDQPLFGLKGLDGKPVGFDVEIAKIVAAKLGIPADKITYTETPSKIREDVIANNQVDMVVATYTINDARKQKVSFAGPYYVAGQDLMVKADNTTITGPDTLKAANARVCSVSGSTPAKNIAKYVDPGNIVLFDVYSKCADALRNGQVEAVTTDNVILSGLVSTSQGAFKLVGKSFTKEPYGIGIAKGDTAFCQFIDDALKASVADGTYPAAWKATAGTVQTEVPTLPTADACS